MSTPDSINLHVCKEGLYFEPRYPSGNGSAAKPSLQILSSSGNILINEKPTFDPFSQAAVSVYGIMGMIQLLSGPYVIVVTGRQLVCRFINHNIWRITATEIIPCDPSMKSLLPQQRADELHYVSLLRNFLATDHLYYSSTYDLSRSLQRQSFGQKAELLGGAVDLRFTVNRFIAEPFLKVLQQRTDTKLEYFLLFCIEGYVEMHTLNVHNRKMMFGLISRRATGRVGTRYHSRGIDDEGNVSNCVETEQVLVVDDKIFSHLQLRGSIPLFWRQNINIRYKPPFEFYNTNSMLSVFEEHFNRLIKDYGQVTAVNLVNQRGWEGELARMFAKLSREYSNPKMNYVAYDFNKECPNMQWHRVQSLLDRVSEDLHQQGYYVAHLSNENYISSVETTQKGVIRTNCIDCLDRTNLVQGFIGRQVLAQQLRSAGVFGINESVPDIPSLEIAYKTVWADNGDSISKQYSGTGALKADFTRTGRRTLRGNISDGLNSLVRYFLNNFSDGARQDAMDLFYGHYTVKLENYYSPFIAVFDRRLLLLPVIMILSILHLFYQIFINHKMHLFTIMISLVVLIFASILTIQNGVDLVQYPKLRPPPVSTKVRTWGRILTPPRRFLESMDPSRKVHVI